MYKFLVLTLLVCQVLYETKCELEVDSEMAPPLRVFDNSSEKTLDLGGVHITGSHQIFYINSPSAWKCPTEPKNEDREIRPDYTPRNGIDAHKIHRRKVTWNMARRICVEEGGHLADIKTTQELQAVKNLMLDNGVTIVWVGFHDLFQEGDWVTVLDEPLGKVEWEPWSKKIVPNPDNAGGNEHCAVYLSSLDGINDDECSTLFPFVCKINMLSS